MRYRAALVVISRGERVPCAGPGIGLTNGSWAGPGIGMMNGLIGQITGPGVRGGVMARVPMSGGEFLRTFV